MKTSSWPRWWVLIAAFVFASVAQATTIIAPDFDSLVGQSDYVVRAVVRKVTAEWRPIPKRPGQRYIGTLVELEVKEVLKGSPPSPLVLDLVGGSLEGQELTIVDAPQFVAGQESILFIKGNGRSAFPLVGLGHGHYPVRRDKYTGQDQVMRSNERPLYAEQEVSLPMEAASTTLARNPRAQPLNSAVFGEKIRRAVKLSSERAPLE